MVSRKPLPEYSQPMSPGATAESSGSAPPNSNADNSRPPAYVSTDTNQYNHHQVTTSGWNSGPIRDSFPVALRPGPRPNNGGSNLSNQMPDQMPPPPPTPQNVDQTDDIWGPPAQPLAPAATGSSGQYHAPGAPDALWPAQPSPAGSSNTNMVSRSETNPFKRKELAHKRSPSAASANSYSQANPPPPAQAFADLDLDVADNSGSGNPWASTPSQQQSQVPTPPPFPSDLAPASQPQQQPPATQQQLQQQQDSTLQPPKSPALLSVSSGLSFGSSSPAWDDVGDGPKPNNGLAPPPKEQGADQEPHEDDDWFDQPIGYRSGDEGKGKGKETLIAPIAPQTTGNPGNSGPMDAWNLVDRTQPTIISESVQAKDQVPETEAPAPVPVPVPVPVTVPPQPTVEDEEGPAPTLPPRRPTEPVPTGHSPRPVDSKSETYQIKKINWHDHKAAKNPRTSPILVQNANGPCPLLALVNALTLTTPAELTDTALVQTLRSREQISLGLLLDAVFDELMSDRRMSENEALPDVGELYEFLKGLHTGMNVNPRFVPSPETVEAFKRTSLTHLHPAQRADLMPGTFEDTVEMGLYSAFSIPLIHGWLPTQSDPVYDSFERQAVSYEDAQNLLFKEEELERKLSGDGLTEDEQQLYQDVITIKSFFEGSATQLTSWGLEVITEAMKPGMVAILFRNDHFSTLYRHPDTKQLLGLVTDAGYSAHAEVVWESLSDVNGLNTEYLSGDFRSVGGAAVQTAGGSGATHGSNPWGHDLDNNTAAAASGGDQRGWTTVGSRGQHAPAEPGHPAPSDVTQEDHDLALAMQLQEEEDERHRTEEARRQRERELSEQYIEQQAQQSAQTPNHSPNPQRGRGGGPDRGGRGTSQAQGRANAHLVSPRTSSSTTGRFPVNVSGTQGRRPSGQSAAQQVRSLVPPVIPQRRPPVNRPANSGEEDAPPSYEQAQSSPSYVPPPGHPSHPTSAHQSPNPGAASPNPGRSPNPQNPASPPMPGRVPTGLGRGQGRPVPQGGTVHSGSRDRDCVVM